MAIPRTANVGPEDQANGTTAFPPARVFGEKRLSFVDATRRRQRRRSRPLYNPHQFTVLERCPFSNSARVLINTKSSRIGAMACADGLTADRAGRGGSNSGRDTRRPLAITRSRQRR